VVLNFFVRPHLLGGGRIKSFPETVTESSKALFIITAIPKRFTPAGNTKVTKSGIKVELYPDNAKVAKQFQHADKRSIPCSNRTRNFKFFSENLVSGNRLHLTLKV
jgi:histidyl-tRNA synthetase